MQPYDLSAYQLQPMPNNLFIVPQQSRRTQRTQTIAMPLTQDIYLYMESSSNMTWDNIEENIHRGQVGDMNWDTIKRHLTSASTGGIDGWTCTGELADGTKVFHISNGTRGIASASVYVRLWAVEQQQFIAQNIQSAYNITNIETGRVAVIGRMRQRMELERSGMDLIENSQVIVSANRRSRHSTGNQVQTQQIIYKPVIELLACGYHTQIRGVTNSYRFVFYNSNRIRSNIALN